MNEFTSPASCQYQENIFKRKYSSQSALTLPMQIKRQKRMSKKCTLLLLTEHKQTKTFAGQIGVSQMDRYFHNPYEDYKGGVVSVDDNYVRNLITEYVTIILAHTNPNKSQRNPDRRGDLYVGNAGKKLCNYGNICIHNTNIVPMSGIAYMFLRLHQSHQDFKQLQPLPNAQLYINDAKRKALPYTQSKSRDERCSFLCGNAGIYSVAALISFNANNLDEMKNDLRAFESGYEACKPINFSRYGSDEVLGKFFFFLIFPWID